MDGRRDDGQELDSGQDSGIACRSWMADRSWIAGRSLGTYVILTPVTSCDS